MSDQRPSPIIGPEGLSSPPQVGAQISAVEKKGDAATEALRREMLLEVRQITTLLSEWRIAHDAVHIAQQRALDAATAALTDKLSDMNEFRQQSRDREATFAVRETVDRSLEALATVINNEKADSRRRFEAIESKMNEMQTLLSREARTEGRPGQDLRTGQDATRQLIALALVVLGILVSVAIYLASTT